MPPRICYTLRLPDRSLVLGERTLVMGVLNVTPDSFADGGVYFETEAAVARAFEMEAEGADLIDIGGESTRPGASPLSAEEELQRIDPVLERLRGRLRVPLSIDTHKSEVARAALARGASIINDVSTLRYDPSIAAVVAASGAALILMHSRGSSRDMYREARYADLMGEVVSELDAAIRIAEESGLSRDRIVVDPGVGFAKRAEQSYAVIAHLADLRALDRPILVGPSRKSFLKLPLGEVAPAEREWGTSAAVTAAVLNGAHLVRVHDVARMVQVVRVADQIRSAV